MPKVKSQLLSIGNAFFRSAAFFPILFLLSQYKVWTGVQTLTADTGDGLAAFKFSGFLPRYWNWYESAGQPFLFDAGAYRLIDPLMWPLIALVKILPTSILVQYNLFQLARIALILWGIEGLFKLLDLELFERRIAQCLCCFGSFSAVMFRSIGMIDLMLGFTFMSWSLLAFIRTGKKSWLFLFTAIVLHSTLSYHLLYLVPVFVLLTLLLGYLVREPSRFSILNQSIVRIGENKIFLGLCLSFIGMALGSEFIMIRDPLLIPALRNFRYNAQVDAAGVVLSEGEFHGQNILKDSTLWASSEACHKTTLCREYQPKLLESLVQYRRYLSLTVFFSFLGLVGLGLFPFFWKDRRVRGVAIFTGIVFLWSLGTKTPFWGFTQRVFPFLYFVRHTGFFVPLFTLSAISLFALVLSHLKSRFSNRFSPSRAIFLVAVVYALILALSLPASFRNESKWIVFFVSIEAVLFLLFYKRSYQAAIFLAVAFECFIFQRVIVESFKDYTLPEQVAQIERKLPDHIVARELRVLNNATIPRSSAATAYSLPSAVESVHRPDDTETNVERRFRNLNWFGFFTPFLMRSYVEARLYFSESPILFDRVFGVAPFSIFSIHSLGSLNAQNTIANKNVALEAIKNQQLLLDIDSTSLSKLKAKNPTYYPPLYGDSVRIAGEKLNLTLTQMSPAFAYLAIPFEAVDTLKINGIKMPFYKANHFGLGFELPEGQLEIEISPQLKTKYLFCALFYLAYFGLGTLALVELINWDWIRGLLRREKKNYSFNPQTET